MAFRTSARLTLATLGVAALAGAGQLGVAYGLGIVRLTRVFDVTTRDQWTTQLAWVAWIAMTSAVVGGLVAVAGRADRAGRRPSPPPQTGASPRSGAGSTSAAAIARTGELADRAWRKDGPRLGAGAAIPLGLAAGVGAAIVVPLTMEPARTAQIAGIHPVLVIGLTTGLGALVGVFAAIAAMMHPVARWSLTTVGIIMWVVAIIAVAPSLSPADPLPEIRLGVVDAGFLSHPSGQRIALLTMPLVALLVGLMLGAVARRQERSTLTIALAGLPGPALLTLAYLIAGPGTGTERYQVVPYWAAMTATGAGVLGSVLAVIIRRGPDEEDDEDREATAEQPPLPRREQQDESAIAKAATDPTGLGSAGGSMPGGTPGGQPTGGVPSGTPSAQQTGGFPSSQQTGGFPSSQQTGGFPSSQQPGGLPGGMPTGGFSGGQPTGGRPSSGQPTGGQPTGGGPSAGFPSAGASKYAGYPSAGESPYGGGLGLGSDRTEWTVPDQRGPADSGGPPMPSASGRPASSAGTWAPWSGYAAAPATSTVVDDDSAETGEARPGVFRGFTAGRRKRTHRAAEPDAQSGMPSPTPLTTPPTAPPPISPPPVAPPPVAGNPGTSDKRRGGGKQQKRDEDYVDWVSGLGG